MKSQYLLFFWRLDSIYDLKEINWLVKNRWNPKLFSKGVDKTRTLFSKEEIRLLPFTSDISPQSYSLWLLILKHIPFFYISSSMLILLLKKSHVISKFSFYSSLRWFVALLPAAFPNLTIVLLKIFWSWQQLLLEHRWSTQ